MIDEIKKCPLCDSNINNERTELYCTECPFRCYEGDFKLISDAIESTQLYNSLVSAIKRHDASNSREQKKCLEDMTEEEYRAWHTERVAARAEVDKFLTPTIPAA